MDIKDYKFLLRSSELKEAIIAEKVCLFLGAGVANNLGMPNWDSLAWDIIKYCTRNEIFGHSIEHTLSYINDPLKKISYCVEQIELNRNITKFKKFLNEIFTTNPNEKYKKTKTSVYVNLIDICNRRKALIVQTNYDKIIEKNVNRKINAIIPYSQSYMPNITYDDLIYLHGKCQNGDYNKWIFNRQQYNDVYVLERSPLYERQKAFLRALLTNYHIIFLGYSLQDVEILQLIANKQEVDKYKKIEVIIDTCEAKKFSNEINAKYWQQYSQNKIDIYSYNTEEGGIERNFEVVIKDLKETLYDISSKTGSILKYINPSELED